MTIEQKQEPKKAKTEGKENSELAHTVRDGGIAANIWRRQSQTGFPYWEYSLSRSWKSPTSGKAGYSQNFFSRNEAQLVNVIRLASEWIAEAESRDQAEKNEALAA